MRKTVLRTLAFAAVLALAAWPVRPRAAAAGRQHRSSPPTAVSRRRRCPSTNSRRSGSTATARSKRPTARRRRSSNSSCSGSTSTARSRPGGCRSARWRNWRRPRTAQARKLCAGAIVGTGFGKARGQLPRTGADSGSSPITIFNGAEAGRQPDRPRPRLPRRPGADDLSSSRSRSRRSTTAATASKP